MLTYCLCQIVALIKLLVIYFLIKCALFSKILYRNSFFIQLLPSVAFLSSNEIHHSESLPYIILIYCFETLQNSRLTECRHILRTTYKYNDESPIKSYFRSSRREFTSQLPYHSKLIDVCKSAS